MLMPMVGALAATSTGWQKRAFQFLSVGVLYRGAEHLFARRLSVDRRRRRAVVLAIAAQDQDRWPRSCSSTALVAAGAAAAVLGSHEHDHRARARNATTRSRAGCTSGRSRSRWPTIGRFTGVGHDGYERAYNQYDWTQAAGIWTNRAVHSAWFGVLGGARLPRPAALHRRSLCRRCGRAAGFGWPRSAARFLGHSARTRSALEIVAGRVHRRRQLRVVSVLRNVVALLRADDRARARRGGGGGGESRSSRRGSTQSRTGPPPAR